MFLTFPERFFNYRVNGGLEDLKFVAQINVPGGWSSCLADTAVKKEVDDGLNLGWRIELAIWCLMKMQQFLRKASSQT